MILGTAFIALIVDYLKGSNEQLREHNVELRVRTEETERRAILDPMRYAHPSILSALRSAVSAKPSATANGATQPAHAASDEVRKADIPAFAGTRRAVTREAPATLVPLTVETGEAAVSPGRTLHAPVASQRPTLGGELLEQVIAATPGGTHGMEPAVVYQEEVPLPPVVPAAYARETKPYERARPARRTPETEVQAAPVPAAAELETPDRVVFVTPVEVEEQEDVRSRPLLHQFEVIGRKRPVITDVPEELAAPVKLQLHTKPESKPEEPASALSAPEPIVASNSWTSILYDSGETTPPEQVAAPEAEPEEAPREWFREPDPYRSRFGSYSPSRPAEEPVQQEEQPEVAEPVAAYYAEPEPVVEEVALEDVVIFAAPERQPAPPAPAVFDVVYSQTVEEPKAEPAIPPVAAFERVARSPRSEPIAWPNPVAHPEPIIFTEPAVLPKSRLKPEGTGTWNQTAASAQTGQQAQEVPVFGGSRALDLPAGYQENSVLEALCREEGLFSGLVVAIGINDFKRVQESAGRAGMDSLLQSVIAVVRNCAAEKGFACRTAEDEFIIVHAGEHGPAAKRRLSQVSERLWDFQLRSLGVASIMFSSGSADVEHERLADAIAAANERMYQTKRSRKTVAMDTGRQKRAVNG
ncbi:MAG: diguanylate cyclase [Acidobacteria bacterium]|nr:diguanylate cyclase [Acidobacteriota bacterium]